MNNRKRIAAAVLSVILLLGAMTGCRSKSRTTAAHTGSTDRMTATTVSSRSSADGPWVPDPCNILGTSGEYDSSGEENGVAFDCYTYEFTADIDEVSKMIVAYGLSMQDLGFDAKRVNVQGSVFAHDYTKDGYLAELAFFAGDAKTISEGGEGLWLAVFAVQDGASFTLGSKTPGITSDGRLKCPGCDGTGRCQGCGGTGRANYGNGYVDCVLCDTTGICNICDGSGS